MLCFANTLKKTYLMLENIKCVNKNVCTYLENTIILQSEQFKNVVCT